MGLNDMHKIRRSGERGHANHGWLDSYHSFSFADYYDPAHMNYSVLRVINEDVVAPGMGFGMHAHRDMEIVTYMISGELRHTDSMGNGSVIRAGDVQRMTAGTGVRHSEINASSDHDVHLLQIWILPNRKDLTPGYEEKHFGKDLKENRWCLIASPDQEGAIHINQDVRIHASVIDGGKPLRAELGADRCAYLQVVTGQVGVEGETLYSGDALMVENQKVIEVITESYSELILFDLPMIAE